MTQQVINIGQSVNDKHGDPIRTAFAKVNNNFTDLYTQVSGLELDAVIPSQSTNGGKYLTTNGTTLSWDDIPQLKNGSATLSLNAQGILTLPSSSYLESTDTNLKVGAQGTVTIRSNAASNLTTKEWTFDTAGHLVPGSDILQDIGTPSNRVRHIYVGPGSISIGDSVLSESTTGKLVVPGLTRATALHADEVQDTVDQTYSFSNVPVVVDSYAYAIFAGMIAPDNSYISAIYNVDQLDSEGFIDGISIDQNATGTWTQAIADINRNNNMFAYIGSDIRESFNAANWIEIPFVVRAKANDVEYEFSTNGSGTGDIRFVSNAMYDLNGIIIENADLEHGSTASVLLPANGSTGEGSEILINNSYSDVAIGTGTNGTLTNFWRFGTDGNLTTPQGGTNTTSSIGQGPDSDWINPNNNTWSIRTYNGGFSGTYTYGEAPLVWWDAANSPMGNSQFRGAVIEYHAYTNQGTVVGTIIISSDFNPVEYTHSEMISGGGQLATYKFWDINSYNRGQVALTTAGDNVNLMIMWTSRVFYGSEFNC
jgi:hypothetical protein